MAGPAPVALEDHHRDIDALALNAAVPCEVVEAYERARNTYLYAWFAYEMTVVAENQAYGALEMALRLRIGPRSDGKRWTGMHQLWEAAVTAGLVQTLPLPPGATEADRDLYRMRSVKAAVRLRRGALG